MNKTLTELADYLRRRQEEIVDHWRRLCEADAALCVVGRLTRVEFRDGIPKALDDLLRVLTRGSGEDTSDAIQSDAGQHGHHRWKQAFSLEQLVREWGKLNQVLVAMIEEFFRDTHPQEASHRTAAMDRLAAFMTEATAGSVHRFDELRRAEAANLASDLQIMKDQFDALTEARSQLLREATHDIRGGLSAVAMASQVLKVSAKPDESFADVLETLERGVESVRDMLHSLLDLSRLESGAEEVEILAVNISEVLQGLATEYRPSAEKNGLTLNVNGPDELIVHTDPRKIRRITQNLLVNALQHTTSGEVRLSWTLEERRWVMSIADTGSGIQDVVGSPVARALKTPSDHGSTSHIEKANGYRGEGIGLTIVKRLCNLLGAGISLESEVGHGTTFTLDFPLDYDQT